MKNTLHVMPAGDCWAPQRQVPPTVLDEIIKRAEKSHPSDYSTQAYVIKEQLRAFIAISVLKAGGAA